MKLMDKIKDLFMDEVIDDDEVELEEEEKREYKEPPKEVLPKVMRDTIEKEEKKSFQVKSEEFIKKEESSQKPIQPVKKFSFPIDFDEEVSKAEEKEEIPSRNARNNDIDSKIKANSLGNGNINVLNLERETTRKVSELYPKKEETKPKFKASPVISPVYGILDKNYTKEEVREKTDDNTTMKRPSKKVDFETVRKKAFGNLADDIKDNLICENCELYKEVKKISALSEDDLLYDMTVDEEKDLTIERAYDNYQEFGVAYEPKVVKKVPIMEPNKEEDELVQAKRIENIINDSNNNDEEEKEDYVIMKSKIDEDEVSVIDEPEDVKKEKVASKEDEFEEVNIPSREEKKKETKVDDDFFELIDSMYKERTDD